MAEAHDSGASASPAPFPLYRAAGTHRQLGRQHGEQARQRIRAHLEWMRGSMQLKTDELRRRAMAFQPLFARDCPHLLEEIAGLAEGAGLPLADALATNIRGALSAAKEGGCTAFVVSRRGTSRRQVLIGQNSDMLPAALDFAYVLHLQPRDKPEALMWTFGGMIGYHGINAHGVGQFANDLGGGPPSRFAMPHYPLKRLMLECRSLDEVRRLVDRVAVWANGNYVLCDGAGRILDLEVTTDGVFPIRDAGSGFLAHSNHFLCAEHATEDNRRRSAPDSFARLDRMNQLIESRFGQLGVEEMKVFLRDRQGHPNGICRVAQTDDPAADWTTAGITVASVIAEPERRCLHVAAGNREDAPFAVYCMDGSAPGGP